MRRHNTIYDRVREDAVILDQTIRDKREEMRNLTEEVVKLSAELKMMLQLKNFPRPHKSWKRVSGPGPYWLTYKTRDEVYILTIRDNQVVMGLLDPHDDRYIYYRNYTVVWRGPQRDNYIEAAVDLYERVAQPAPEE